MDKDFLEEAEKMRNDKLFKVDDFYFDNFPRLSADFKENFRQACEVILQLQKEGKAGELGFAEYAFKREDILARNYNVEMWVYGRLYWEDKMQVPTGHFLDISPFFQYFDELWDELSALVKQNAWKVNADVIKEFMWDSVHAYFYQFVYNLGYYSIVDCIDKDYFTAIKKRPRFEIWTGELGENTKNPIHKINLDKDSAKLLKQFKKKDKSHYRYEDLTNLDFSGADLSGIDFRCSDFRYSVLKDVNFRKATLFRARFAGANLENANLNLASVSGADFTGANLKNANIEFSVAQYKIPGVKWGFVGYFPVSFQNADLRGANFIGAGIEKADFTGALMDSANFNRDWWESRLDLTPEQLNSIIFVDDEYSEFVKKEDL